MQTGPVLARRQRPRRAPHGRRGTARDQQLRDRHGPPDRGRPKHGCQQQNQRAADDEPPRDGDEKRSARLEDGLKIIRGKDIQRQQHGGQHGRREIRVRLCLPRHAAAALGAEQDAATDTREQAETINDIPHRRHDRQRCRAVRPLILADHRHVHNAVNARDERATERCQKVSAVERTHIAPEQVQKHPPWKRKSRTRNRHFSLRLIRLPFL